MRPSAWDAAPFAALSATLAPAHDALVEALAPRPRERVLDVGTGTGPVALRAARAGARVTALDLSPRMLEAARLTLAGLDVRLVRASVERMPFPDGSFDVVASAQGVIFAADAEGAAGELARVCAPGGRLGLSVLADTAAARELVGLCGGTAPLAWGRADGLERLLGERFALRVDELAVPLRARSPEELWRLYAGSCGPLRLVASPRVRQAFLDLVERHGGSLPRDLLLVLGRCRLHRGDDAPQADDAEHLAAVDHR